MTLFGPHSKHHNVDDNRPVCTRCNEPVVYGHKELHSQHCKECGQMFCGIHDCSAQNTADSKKKSYTQTTYYVKLGQCRLEPVQANSTQVYKEKWDRILLPTITEDIVVDQILKLLRDKSVAEIDIKILKTE